MSVSGRTKAVIVDGDAMTVIWMNDAAAEDLGVAAADAVGTPLSEGLPLTGVLAIAEAAENALASGEPRHLSTDLVHTAQGSVKIVASVYPVPDRRVLVLVENAWEPRQKARQPGKPDERGRRGRR